MTSARSSANPSRNTSCYASTGPKNAHYGIEHRLDVFTDITPESWEILSTENEYARAWTETFPYAALDDPCERGIAFVTVTPPYDQWQVRWALALATDIQRVSLSTFAGMLRVSPLATPPITVLQETYHKPMRDWLTNEFTLPDGYAPFDPDFAVNIAATLTEQGIEDLPTDEAALVDIFGVGWWKHDPDKAAELLRASASRDTQGKWLKPDGSPDHDHQRPSQLRGAVGPLGLRRRRCLEPPGIDVNVAAKEGGSFWND